MNVMCLLRMHIWEYDKEIESTCLNLMELSQIEKSFFTYKLYYCIECGLIKLVSLTGINHYYRQYYREYAKSSGWGVMIGYDKIIATSKRNAKRQIPNGMYGRKFDLITPVKVEHLKLDEDSLANMYGQ